MTQPLATRFEHELDSRSVAVAAWLYRRTGGRIARLYDRDVLLLSTTGRRTGRRRTVPLQFFVDGDDMVVVAANSGMSTHPAWYLNLTAHPEAVVEVYGDTVDVRAEVLDTDEAEAFWPKVLDRAPDYSRYRTRTDRTIPLVRLKETGRSPTRDRETRRRPIAVNATVAALGSVGVTALAGGTEMIVAPKGNVFVEGEWLEHIPLVDTYRIPGGLLAGLGAGSLGAAFGLARLHSCPALRRLEQRTGQHWAWSATAATGVSLTAWIATEVLVVPKRSVVELVYALTGVGLLAACAHPDVRGYTRLGREATPGVSEMASSR